MVLVSCAMGLVVSSSFAVSMLYVVFRAAEESAKLSNTVLLSGLCEEFDASVESKDRPGIVSKAVLLAKAVALQKMTGSVLKVCTSLLQHRGPDGWGQQRAMGSAVCAVGTLWIFKIMPAIHNKKTE